MLFTGPWIFKKTGALFQEEFYLPSFILNKLVIRFLMDGLALCVFLKSFLLTKLTTQLQSPSIAIQRNRWQWTNQRHCCHCIATCHWLNHVSTFYRAPWLVSKSFRASALWRQDWDISNQNMVMLLIFKGDLFTEENSTSKCSVNMMKKYINLKRKLLKDSGQERFFLVYALFFNC